MSYYSRNTIKELERPVAAEVKQIMHVSNLNNPAAGITGGLVFNAHYFAQILEGDRKAVTQTFCRIANDERHNDIVMLEAQPIDNRMFDGWAMAYAGHSPEVDRIYLRYGTAIGFAPSKMTASAFVMLVKDLVETGSRIAMTPLVDERGQAAATNATKQPVVPA
ncbi:MAG: BLUF domain-containing protein [Cohaesibacteraceae bacterium]